MKQLTALLLSGLLLASLCACGKDVGIIGGQDGPSVVISGQLMPETPVQPESTPVVPETPPAAEPPAPVLPAVSGEMDPYNRTWREMQSADFWLALCENSQEIRMTAEEIARYNTSLSSVNGTKVEKLTAWPSVLSHMELCDLLDRYGDMPKDSYYTPEGRITADQQAQMNANRNRAAVGNQNTVQYGFLTENLIMRTFPSA